MSDEEGLKEKERIKDALARCVAVLEEEGVNVEFFMMVVATDEYLHTLKGSIERRKPS